MNEYIIAKDGKSIKCLKCGMTSCNPLDVQEKYCGHCNIFHGRGEGPKGIADVKAYTDKHYERREK